MTEKFTLEAKIEVMRALGLDPTRVCGEDVVLKIPLRGVPTVTVQLFVTDEHMRVFSQVVKGYELVERWDAPASD
jgi:hypothetical protein